MIKQITAKVLLSRVKGPDPWFGFYYNMNLYRGCEHRCIYCDSRSECYRIENFHDILVKVNAIDLLKKELASKRIRGTIGTGSMNDPYTPTEARLNMTGQALDVIAQYGFPVHILTKSDLILKDLDTLRKINRVGAAVSFTITTTDDELAKKIEPYAPLPSRRLEALKILADAGIETRIAMMPILPFIEDTKENITTIVRKAHECGVGTIVPWFGMSLRDRQRAYYYMELDKSFPGLRREYEQTFGDRYQCASPKADRLANVFYTLCKEYAIATSVKPYSPERATQLGLF